MPDTLSRTLPPTRRTLGDVDPAQPLGTTHPLLRGVQGFWLPLPRFVGGSRLYDLSTYSNHAGLVDTQPEWVSRAEFAFPYLRFTGTNGWGEATTSSVSGTVTIALSFIPQSFAGSGGISQSYLEWRTSSLNDGVAIGLNEDNAPILYIIGDSTGGTGGTSLTVGQHHTLVGVLEQGNRMRVYLDGKIERDLPTSDTSTPLSKVSIGAFEQKSTNKAEIDLQTSLVASGGWDKARAQLFDDQARRGFPDLLNRRSDVGLLGGGGTSPISGTFALTDSQEQFSATGQTEVSGTLSVTDGSETLTLSGATKVSGTASITEAAEQVAASGTVITTGSVSITDGGEIISAVSSLQDITGTAQITDAGEEVSATGGVKIAGTASLADGTEEIVIIGENDITGAVSFADLAAEIIATGSVEVQGSLALTESGETITARERVPARLATVDVRLEDIIIVNAKLTD